MSPNLENLIQYFRAVQHFASLRVDRDSLFKNILQNLSNISASLNSEKLSIQIFSQIPLLSQGFYNCLNQSQPVRQAYQLDISEFPTALQLPQYDSASKLTLLANPALSQQESHYELLPHQSVLIGRDQQRLSQDFRSQNAHIISLSSYNRVSSVHAQVQIVANPASSAKPWQICDLNSTNGTYVNGQKVKGCQVLKTGDKITLTNPTTSNKVPEFTFQSTNSIDEDEGAKQNIGEVVCLVVAPQQLLTTDEMKFVDMISKFQVAAFLVIVDTSGLNEQSIQKVEADIKSLNEQFQTQYPALAESILPMHFELHPFYQNDSQIPVQPVTQQKIDWLYGVLSRLATSRDEVIAERIAKELTVQIIRIEQFFNEQEAALDSNILRTESLLRNQTLDSWREQIRKKFNRVSEERGDFFNSVSNELRRSSSDFSSPIVAGSLMQKIKSKIDELNPVVTKYDNQVCIQLKTGSSVETHNLLLQFCQAHITLWVAEEWGRICSNYGGGLNNLIQSSYGILNCLPSLVLSNSFSQPKAQVDIQRSLQVSFVDIEDSISFHNGTVDALGNVLSIGVRGAFAAGLVALGDPRAMIQVASLAASLASLIGSTLNRSQLQNLKLEQTVLGLKQNLYSSYQAIARHILDRVLQDINVALAFEDKRFRKALEQTEEQFTSHFADLTNVWEGYRVQKNNMVQERSTLQQIRSLV